MSNPVLHQVLAAWEALMGTPLIFTEPDEAPPDSPWRVPLEHDGESLGWLSVQRPPADFTEDQMVGWLNLLGQLVSTAIGERNVSTGLAEEVLSAWNQQVFLFEALKVNAANTSFDDVAEKLSRLAQGVFRCENAFLAFRDGKQVIYRSARPVAVENIDEYFARLAESAVVTLNDSTPVFLGARIPLTTPGEAIIGMIGSEAGQFRARDRQLADSLAEQIGTVLDNIALHRQLRSSLRLQHELEIAAEIQTSLLPASLPQPPGFDLAGLILTASQVGGDFYDVVELKDGSLAVLMGDVAGKGIPAAMLTTLIRAELRGEVLGGVSPGQAVARANSALEPDLTKLDTFATALVAHLKPQPGALTLASAGHTASLLWRARTQTATELLSTTLPLGIFRDSDHVEQTFSIEPGDVLVFYSDGLTEALGPDGTLFGWNGLKEVVQAVSHGSAETILQAVIQASEVHRRGKPLSDDLSLLVIKRHDAERPLACRSFVFPAQLTSLRRLEPLVMEVLGERALDPALEDWRHEFSLAAVEHVSNLVRHAYNGQTDKRVYGLLARYADRLVLETMDTGRPFDWALMPTRSVPLPHWKDLPEGGYGLPLIRAVMHDLRYERREPSCNHWHLMRKLP